MAAPGPGMPLRPAATTAGHGTRPVTTAGQGTSMRLDEVGLRSAVDALAAIDADLAGIIDRHGPPPLWERPPGFETLVRIILEQQVSLRSAEAALGRLVGAAGAVDPEAVVAAGESVLRDAGLTRQKARYLVGLAGDVVGGRFDLGAVAHLGDDDARAALTGVLGIGRWTADIYLLMALGRPDIWPVGDLALAGSMRRAKGLANLPSAAQQVDIAAPWRPWRAVAARLLWHAYLAGER